MPSRDGWPPALAALSTDKHRRFAWAYLFNGGCAAEAARWAGYSDHADGAKVRGCELLQRDDVHAALRELSTKYLFSLAPRAITRLGELLDQPQHPKHFNAIELTMRSTYFPDQHRVEHHHTGSVEISHTDAALEALAYLKSMDVPRDKLVQQFGASGLARYERMLAERDEKRGGPKLIEGKVE